MDGIHQLRQFHRFGHVSFEADVEGFFYIIIHDVGAYGSSKNSHAPSRRIKAKKTPVGKPTGVWVKLFSS